MENINSSTGFNDSALEELLPAEGKFKPFPKFSDLVCKYPIVGAEQVWEDIGGKVLINHKNQINEEFENTCALRMSKSFNDAGYPIQPTADDKKRGRAGSGAQQSPKEWFYYAVNDFSRYLNTVYGPQDHTYTISSTVTADDVRQILAGRKGIIVFVVSGWSNATGHFSYWDGVKVLYGDYFHPEHSSANAVLRQIKFWELYE